MYSSWKIGSVLHCSYIIILSHLSVRKPGGEAVSKGGRGVGSQMGSTLPLHTGYVLRYVIIGLDVVGVEAHLDREAGGD